MKNISPAQKTLIRETIRLLKLLRPPPAVPVWAWGELRRRMGKNVTARPGRYRVSTTPYQKEPQEAFLDKDVQTTVLYWAKRLGKTEMINNLHGWVMECSPRNILHCMPTLDSVKKWSKQFLTPMIRSTPILRGLIKTARQKDANNTILAKEFPGGTISGIGANSVSGFRQVQAPVVTCDEVDAMDNTEEGDPITLAFGRAENYSDSIQIVSSTATRINMVQSEATKGSSGSRIHDWWLKSDQRKWFVPCGCGQWHVLAWANVKWEEGHKHEGAWYEAPCCGGKWDDYVRVKAVLAGEWRPTAPFNGVRGYWLNGLNTTFPAKKGYRSKLHQMAAEFYDAYKGGESTLRVWKNTFLCEPYEESVEQVETGPILERLEDYKPAKLPLGVVLITAQVDIQKDRLEVEVLGHGLDEETWGIEVKKLYGDTEQGEVWQNLSALLAGKYLREDGVELGITATAIDTGFRGERARHFAKHGGIPRVFMVRGSSGEFAAKALVTGSFDKRTRIHTYAVNTKEAKDIIFARLRIEEPGPRYCHFPNGHGYSEDYFQQLTAEVLKSKYIHGFRKEFYEKIRDRNEALDLRVYGLACLKILNVGSMAQIAASLKPKTPPQQPREYILHPEPQLKIQQPKPTAWPKFKNKGGFIGGWK